MGYVRVGRQDERTVGRAVERPVGPTALRPTLVARLVARTSLSPSISRGPTPITDYSYLAFLDAAHLFRLDQSEAAIPRPCFNIRVMSPPLTPEYAPSPHSLRLSVL